MYQADIADQITSEHLERAIAADRYGSYSLDR